MTDTANTHIRVNTLSDQDCLNWSHSLCLTIFDNMTFLGTFCVNQYSDKPQSFNNFSIQHTHFEWKQCWMCILYNKLYKTAAILSCLLHWY